MKPKPFKLFKTVLNHPDFGGLLSIVWSSPVTRTKMDQLWKKLKAFKVGIKELNTYRSSYDLKLTHARHNLERTHILLINTPLCPTLMVQEKHFLVEFIKWSDVEEQVLKQKSIINWILSGDANTSYVHAQVKFRATENL